MCFDVNIVWHNTSKRSNEKEKYLVYRIYNVACYAPVFKLGNKEKPVNI